MSVFEFLNLVLPQGHGHIYFSFPKLDSYMQCARISPHAPSTAILFYETSGGVQGRARLSKKAGGTKQQRYEVERKPLC